MFPESRSDLWRQCYGWVQVVVLSTRSPYNITKGLPCVLDLVLYAMFGTELTHTWRHLVVIVTRHGWEKTVQ